MFDEIKNDKYIKSLFDKIDKVKIEKRYWSDHGLYHTNNVINIVESVLKQLNYDDEFIEQAKIASILHDIGNIYGKEGHADNSYKLAKEYFIKNNIDTGNNDMILEAIKYHRNGIANNKIAGILTFADKIDSKKDRLTPEGLKVEGMREMQFIDDIIIKITDGILTVNFICSDTMNKDRLESFYFIPKIFNAINNFAIEFNLKPVILYNDNEWILEH